ncbi:Lrp/AsnC family transcriptional regulator [Arthrobacter sp. ISL-5]|uniref:Lrp/AsnC family transcriptional regulator n=1 Tax=Arthrobacter sp. ISL-5 TaxID=2819111 RepID=UPI001BE9D404|nr:AsnC family transcriptional regulator [Arthrobacter sp. ISL-5]MBT2555942.1 AsnC family transcriptional regulator [Arthrobacter sp. ISL-5]
MERTRDVEQLDALDRQIVAALIRNGRAPWRLIAEVLGQQERTVARRGNKLLDSGVVRTNSFVNPSSVSSRSAFLLRVTAAPRELRSVCAWLAQREESSWVSALSGANEAVAELFLSPDELGNFLYRRLAEVKGVQSFTMTPLLEYFRTPTGWTPDVLDRAQYAALHPGEDERLTGIRSGHAAEPLDEINASLAELLHRNGRATVDDLASELSISKATVSRRLEAMMTSGVLFIRAVVDPAALGFPVEAILSLTRANTAADQLGQHLADLPVTRWAAASGEQMLAQVALSTLNDLRVLLDDLRLRKDIHSVRPSIYAEIFKRSTVIYRNGEPEKPPLAADPPSVLSA